MSSVEIRVVLITGITGQDGSYLAEYLQTLTSASLTYRIIGISRQNGKTVKAKNVEYEYGDIQDVGFVTSLIRKWQPREMYHLAGQSSRVRSIEAPCETILNTGYATCVLLEAIKGYSPHTRFFHASSSEIYGLPTHSPQNESLPPPHPLSPYAVAKMTGHYFLQYYRETYGIFGVSGILYNHESPRRNDEFVTQKIAKGIAAILAKKATFIELGNLDAQRDWGHAKDFVRAMHASLQTEKPQDYVIATGKAHSVRDFCEIGFASVGLDYKDYVRGKNTACLRQNDFCDLIGDSTRAATVLKWKPQITFTELVQEMVTSARQEQHEEEKKMD